MRALGNHLLHALQWALILNGLLGVYFTLRTYSFEIEHLSTLRPASPAEVSYTPMTQSRMTAGVAMGLISVGLGAVLFYLRRLYLPAGDGAGPDHFGTPRASGSEERPGTTESIRDNSHQTRRDRMKIACPRCEQDWVKKVYVGITDQTVLLCYECEATWFCEDAIEMATFLDLSTYLGRKKIPTSSDTYSTFVNDPRWPPETA